MTHAELVAAARRWLCARCPVVVTELATQGETPDALGWRGWSTLLIECKATRTDFFADAEKWFRRAPACGVGTYRYYLVPDKLVDASEVPDGWGLLECFGNRVRVRVESRRHEANTRQETRILLSTLRRCGQHAPDAVSIRCYQHQTGNSASLSVEAEALQDTLPVHPTGAAVASELPAQVFNDHPPGTAEGPLQ